MQKALAHFGYYDGTIDGISGRQTRAAISDLQTQQEWPVTGQLTDDQKRILLTNYADAQNGQSAPAAVDNQAKVDQLFAMINGQNPGAGGARPGPTVSPIPARRSAWRRRPAIVGLTAETPPAPQHDRRESAARDRRFGKHCPTRPAAAAPTGGVRRVSRKEPGARSVLQRTLGRLAAVGRDLHEAAGRRRRPGAGGVLAHRRQHAGAPCSGC